MSPERRHLIGKVDFSYSKFWNEMLENKTRILAEFPHHDMRYDAFGAQTRHVSQLKITDVIFPSSKLFY